MLNVPSERSRAAPGAERSRAAPGAERSLARAQREPASHPRAGGAASDPLGSTGRPLDFEAVYEEHFDFVWRSMGRLGVEPSAVEDAAQDVFVVAHRRLSEFEGRSSVKTWLFGIALRVARDHQRAARRKRSHGFVHASETDTEAVPDVTAPSPLDAAARAEAVATLQAILGELDEDQRAVFILAELEDTSAPEIAEAVGANVNTVYTRLRAARKAFNEAVTRHAARDGWRQR